MSNLKTFHETWSHPDYPPEIVDEKELKSLEDNFGITLPASYRSQLLQIGLPRPTAKLWNWLCQKEDRQMKWLDRLPVLAIILPECPPHLSDFHAPTEMREALAWREAGMPDHLLPFAHDSAGNQICFAVKSLRGSYPSESPVVVWDHEFLTTRKLAKSFDAFLKLYLR
jgi:hypothetical protein